MPQPTLAIQIITYNRAEALERTLAALHQFPSRNCSVAVFDNASTDATPRVLARHEGSFANLEVVRHARNIGVSANYLRAVEASRARYTWVIADDDEYDMTAALEVLEVLERGECDLAWLGPTFDGSDPRVPDATGFHDGRAHRLSELRTRLGVIFAPLTFLPTLVFKTDLFTDECVRRGHSNSPHHYPQFPFVATLVRSDPVVHVVSRQLVRMGGTSQYPSQLYFRWCWLASCSFVTPETDRRAAMLEWSRGSLARFLKSLAGDVLEERALKPAGAADLFWLTWSRLPSAWRTLALPLALAAWAPPAACRLAARSRVEAAWSFDDPLRL